MALQSRTSGLLTADALIHTGRCALVGFIVNPTANTAGTLTLFDGLTATGKVLAKVNMFPSTATEIVPLHVDFKRPVTAEIGIFADMTTITDYVVYHN